MLDSCAMVTGEHSQVEWPNEYSAADWLARLLTHREDESIGWQHPKYKHLPTSALKASLHSLPLAGVAMQIMIPGANFSGTNLSDAKLGIVNLVAANLSGAILSESGLYEAHLREANLSGANLSESNLDEANLRRVDLTGADLSGANLTEANLSKANLSNADLSDVRNLADAILSPSQRAAFKKKGLL